MAWAELTVFVSFRDNREERKWHVKVMRNFKHWKINDYETFVNTPFSAAANGSNDQPI